VTPRELSRATGVSTDTLRHYEAKGLLRKPARTAAGYRRYTDDAVRQVRLIQRSLAVGFSLNELAKVLRERDRGGAPCRSVYALVSQRLAALDGEMAALAELRKDLQALLGAWDQQLASTPEGRQAHLLESLAAAPKGFEHARRLRARKAPGRGN
jgi:DNA-binding transcriptional MerR regulator